MIKKIQAQEKYLEFFLNEKWFLMFFYVKGIESLPQALIFKSLYLSNQIV